MIFDKLLSHRNLDFDIVLDKENYIGGDKVNGILTITAKADFKLRGLRLIAEGIEKTVIPVKRSSSSTSFSSSSNRRVETMTASHTFFFQDLSSILSQINKNVVADEDGGKPSLVVDKGIREFPFEFDIPKNAYPSYKGKCAKITYYVKATADRDNWIDKNKTTEFMVDNSNHQSNPIDSNKNDDIDYSITNNKSRWPSNLQIRPGNIGFNFGEMNYDSNHFRKKYGEPDLGTSVEFAMSQIGLDNAKGSTIEKAHDNISFSSGHTIKGNVVLNSHVLNKKPNKIELILIGFEYAYAQGYSRINKVEEYRLVKETSNFQLKEYETNTGKNTVEVSKGVDIDSVDKYVIPFEIYIPQVSNKSYVGKYSEFFWVFDAKINIPFSKDIHCKSIISIT